jgi:hypothetical protein
MFKGLIEAFLVLVLLVVLGVIAVRNKVEDIDHGCVVSSSYAVKQC